MRADTADAVRDGHEDEGGQQGAHGVQHQEAGGADPAEIDIGKVRQGLLQVGDDVAAVLGDAGKNAIARCKSERIKSHVPAAGRVLHECDFVGMAVE